jgi:hypothetical protein
MLQVNLPSVRQVYKNWDGGGLEKGWEKLLTRLSQSQDAPPIIPLEAILDACGLDDASIALQAVKGHVRPSASSSVIAPGKRFPFLKNTIPRICVYAKPWLRPNSTPAVCRPKKT